MTSLPNLKRVGFESQSFIITASYLGSKEERTRLQLLNKHYYSQRTPTWGIVERRFDWTNRKLDSELKEVPVGFKIISVPDEDYLSTLTVQQLSDMKLKSEWKLFLMCALHRSFEDDGLFFDVSPPLPRWKCFNSVFRKYEHRPVHYSESELN